MAAAMTLGSSPDSAATPAPDDRLAAALAETTAARERAQLLLDVTRAVSAELDTHALIGVVSGLLTNRIHHHFASLTLWDESAQRLRRYGLAFPDGKGIVQEGVVTQNGGPASLAYERQSTVLLRWADIEALGEPTTSVMAVEGLRSVCCVPLKTARGIYGTLNVGKAADDPFSIEERELIEQIAQPLAVAFENAINFERANAYREAANAERDRVQLLLEITNAVVSELDLEKLLSTCSWLLREKIRHHYASLTIWDETAGALRREAMAFETGRGVVPEGGLVAPDSPAQRAFDSGETVQMRWREIASRGGTAFEVMDAEGLRSTCSVPIKTARAKYGVLNVAKPEDEPFPPTEVTLLEQVAQQLAIAIENARSFERADEFRREAEARRERLELLLEVNNALISKRDSHAFRLTVLGAVKRVVDHDYASLAIYDRESRELRLEAMTFYDERGVLEPRVALPIGGSPAGIAFQTQTTRLFDGAALDRFKMDGVPFVRPGGMRFVCNVPLITSRGVVGVLNVARRNPAGFTRAEVELLGEAASQVAIAVENTLAYQEISELRDRLAEEKLYLESEITQQHEFTEIVGRSRALTAVLQQIRTVAATDATVLLLGETGTGKELLARAVHHASQRAAQTFVRVNGAALPAGLIESELFGYERGAFTGATTAKAGRFELAHRGTLFLDEVGDIPFEVQPKLLRALQEQEFERLGSTRTQRVDVRLIAATNRNLEEMVAAGTFRSDLYYRLSVFPIRIPPLRERPEDIDPLVRHFVAKFARELGRAITTIPVRTMTAFEQWSWPGNIRELANLIERAVILSSGPALEVPQGLFGPSGMRGAAAVPPPSRVAADPHRLPSYEEGEREIILRALRESKGVIAGPGGAAERLGLKRTTLHSKMRKLGINRPTY